MPRNIQIKGNDEHTHCTEHDDENFCDDDDHAEKFLQRKHYRKPIETVEKSKC